MAKRRSVTETTGDPKITGTCKDPANPEAFYRILAQPYTGKALPAE